ncbi:MAG TPA: MarR family transcriptional regulator [Actinomycetota bacterium]|nr:MarR family transcriptional regulator [Actinomycetota bacterium]
MTTRTEHSADGRLSEDGEAAVEPRRVDRAAFEREFRSGDATATECAQNLMRAAELFTDADARGLRRHGLSIAARILLATLEGAGEPLSQTAIAERLFLTGASVSSLVNTLERTRLVRRVRSVSDRRVVLVELTDAAYPVIDAYLADVTTLHAHEFAVLDDEERETFVRLLAKVAASIEALDVDAVVASARPRKRARRTR